MVVVGFTVLVIKGVCTEVVAIDVEYFSEKLLESEKYQIGTIHETQKRPENMLT